MDIEHLEEDSGRLPGPHGGPNKPVLQKKGQGKRVQPRNMGNSPLTYLECIKEVSGSFLSLSPNSSKSIIFYQNCIRSLYQKNRQLAEKISNQKAQNSQMRNDLLSKRSSGKQPGSLADLEVEQEKRKRKRRKAKEITRLYNCKDSKCDKTYGSEGALSHHMKEKHPELEGGSPECNSNGNQKPVETIEEQEKIRSGSSGKGQREAMIIEE